MATVLDIVRGISQAAANGYDGSQYENYSYDGEARKIGLKREEGNPLLDSRVIDGFSTKFHGNQLCISYQSEIKLKDVYAGDIEAEVDDMIQKVANFIKKEYKKITGDSLSLTATGEVDVLVQNTSKVRVFVVGKRYYKIGNLDGVLPESPPSEDRLDKSIRDFIALGKK
jgi:hypothetical protein